MHLLALRSFALLALISSATAHYKFTSLILNGVVTGEYQYVRPVTSAAPVLDLTNLDLRCGPGGLSPPATVGTAVVAAGSTVGFKLDSPISHIGPTLAWLAKAPGAVSSYSAPGSPWFKIYQLGAAYSSSGGAASWPSLGLTQVLFNIPANTPAGEYLLRIEHIHLTQTAVYPGTPAFYVACANIKIVGGGTGAPTGYAIPGVYQAGDPGLVLPGPNTPYTPPGPPVWS